MGSIFHTLKNFLYHSFWILTQFLSSFWKSKLLRKLQLRQPFHLAALAPTTINKAKKPLKLSRQAIAVLLLPLQLLVSWTFQFTKEEQEDLWSIQECKEKEGEMLFLWWSEEAVYTHTVSYLNISLETAVIWISDREGTAESDWAPRLPGEEFFLEILGAQHCAPRAGFNSLNANMPSSYI